MIAHDCRRRDQLAYLALYHAIAGNESRSEQIRRVIRKLEQETVASSPVLEAVPA